MPVNDKAVSTEDLCAEEVPPALGVLRLEAILTTLVENKVEALKQENGKNSSVHSSPKSILQKLKCHSSPKTTLKIENEKKKDAKRREKKDKSHRAVSESRQFKRQVLRQETSSPDSQILHGDENIKYTGNVTSCKSPSCMDPSCRSHICYCNRDHHPVSMHVNDDYISIKMDGYGDIETDAIIAQEELKRARRKRRRRRKRRLKKRLALNPHLVDTFAHDNESFKALHEDELPPRAKWTIVATACLLLFMCLLLVGITLRMAPIIDEIDFDRSRRQSDTGSARSIKRINSRITSRKRSSQINKEEILRQKRRKKIINIIISVYFFLFCVSILCVVITLTHRTTATICDNNNNTKNLTYYTFSPNPVVLYEDNR